MKKYLFFFLEFLLFYDTDACADVVYGANNVYSISSFDDNNVIIEHGAIVNADNVNGINMDDYVYLYNNGTINGNIHTNGNNLFLYNTGTISDGITGNVRQIIRSSDEANNINVIGNYSVKIDKGDNLNFDDIKNISASSFCIKESSIIINDFNDWQNWNKTVSLEGPITLILNDYQTVTDGAYVNHVVAGDQISIRANNLDNLHKIELTQSGQSVILNIVRETNYNKTDALDNNNNNNNNQGTGNSNNNNSGSNLNNNNSSNNQNRQNSGGNHVLQDLRNVHPNDRLLNALDSANSAAEMNRIKNKSARFNHGILLRPIKLINSFSLISGVNNNSSDFGMGFMPGYIVSDNIKNAGGRVYFDYNRDKLYFNTGFSFNKFSYKDELNDFYGFMYGIDFRARKYFSDIWVDALFGLNRTKFKTDYVSAKNELKNNPDAVSWYFGTDVGHDFNLLPDITVAPFVGVGYQYYSVIDTTDDDFYIRGGAEIKYSFAMEGIKYEYSFMSGAGNHSWFAGIKAGFWSIVDKAGVFANVGMVKDDMGYSGQLSLNAKMSF